MERVLNNKERRDDEPAVQPKGTGGRRGAERRERILAAAREHFVAHGYGATSVDEIVSKAGGSKATVYAAFGGKEGLFRALIAEITASIEGQSTQHVIAETLPPRQALTEIGHAALGFILTPGLVDLFRLAVGESGRFPELGRAFWKSGPESTGEAVAVYLRQQVARGTLVIEDANEASDVFFAILVDRRVISAALGMSGFPTPDQARLYVERAVDLFMRMFGPQNAAPSRA